MKTLRYRNGNSVKPAVLDNNKNIRDVSKLIRDWDDTTITKEKIESIKSIDLSTLPLVEKFDSLAPPICKKSIGKFICIGLNYSDHAAETGMEVPKEPIIFMKATSCICGPDDDIELEPNSKKLDWEVELGIVIGKETKNVSEKEAGNYILGYCLFSMSQQSKIGKSSPTRLVMSLNPT